MRRTLSLAFLETHLHEAAIALEAQSPEDAASVLSSVPDRVAADILATVSPHYGVSLCMTMDPERFRAALEALPLNVAAGILRRMPPERREDALDSLPQQSASDLRSLLRFPEDSAGALMDPHVLALSGELTAADALHRVREEVGRVLYNLYVVDPEHVLIGVLNLQELLAADPRQSLATIMNKAGHRLRAVATRPAILQHPGWRCVYSLPVVDGDGRFLGAVRYATLRRIETELAERDGGEPYSQTARALGELFSTGIGGMIEAVASAVSPPPGPSGGQGRGSREDRKGG